MFTISDGMFVIRSFYMILTIRTKVIVHLLIHLSS